MIWIRRNGRSNAAARQRLVADLGCSSLNGDERRSKAPGWAAYAVSVQELCITPTAAAARKREKPLQKIRFEKSYLLIGKQAAANRDPSATRWKVDAPRGLD
ncbi:hypothetical protein Dimus_025072, partial [Dionaea muscipula]